MCSIEPSFQDHISNAFKMPITTGQKFGFPTTLAAGILAGGKLIAPAGATLPVITLYAAVGGLVALIGILAYRILRSYQLEEQYQKALTIKVYENEARFDALKIVADYGHPEAQVQLAEIYRSKDGFILDNKIIALSYYEKAFSQGKRELQKTVADLSIEIARTFSKGNETLPNLQKALFYYDKCKGYGYYQTVNQYVQEGIDDEIFGINVLIEKMSKK